MTTPDPIPESIKTIHSHFNYQTIWQFLQSKGKELYGNNFRLCHNDTDIILKLVVWFIRDKDQFETVQIDLNKVYVFYLQNQYRVYYHKQYNKQLPELADPKQKNEQQNHNNSYWDPKAPP